jgi:hypothetical protein
MVGEPPSGHLAPQGCTCKVAWTQLAGVYLMSFCNLVNLLDAPRATENYGGGGMGGIGKSGFTSISHNVFSFLDVVL